MRITTTLTVEREGRRGFYDLTVEISADVTEGECPQHGEEIIVGPIDCREELDRTEMLWAEDKLAEEFERLEKLMKGAA